jgi:alkyldihydroxyacetonephosphate synthase
VDALRSLPDFLPAGVWTTAPAERAGRARDWWPITAIRQRRGVDQPIPAVVILPRTTEEVAATLRWASQTRTPLIPRGGGSGVCGGVFTETEGRAVLDLSRMNRVLDLDLESQVVRVQAGIRGGQLEAKLNERGLTLGHSPQSVELSSVGGWIAAASAGQFTPAYGAIEDGLLGYTAVTGDGLVFHVRPVPRSAAATNLRRLLLGSEGSLAVVTEATLACAPRPGRIMWQAFGFPAFGSSLRWARRVTRERTGPHVVRGYDEADAVAAFFEPLGHSAGAVGLCGFDGATPGLGGRMDAVTRAAFDEGGAGLDSSYGAHWLAHRLDAVELFERANGPARSLGAGAMLDTLEVAALWRDLDGVYDQVRGAIGARAEEARCHFSHVYPAGAALYFTFVLRASDDEALEAVYADTWKAAIDACLAARGTTTHHHGIGRLRAGRIEEELGEGAAAVVRRLKAAMDPAGVLNPGALLPPSPRAEAVLVDAPDPS